MSVLLVDDNPEIQNLVESTLQQDGLSVVSTDDGLSALDIAISEKPDLILVDSAIKGIDIFTFVKKIKRRASLAETPIILLLNPGERPDPAALQSAGLSAILKKPIDPTLLSKEVKKKMGIAPQNDDVPSLDIEKGFLSNEAMETFGNKAEDTLSLDLLDADDSSTSLTEKQEKTSHSEQTKISELPPSIDERKVDEAIRRIVTEVVERVAWEVVPGLAETAVQKMKIQSLVEQVVWEVVPSLAEIEIKKEIKRLQPDEDFSS